MHDLPWIFGVDFERELVIFSDGGSAKVDEWYADGRKCPKAKAIACVFQGEDGKWYAVDIQAFHCADRARPLH